MSHHIHIKRRPSEDETPTWIWTSGENVRKHDSEIYFTGRPQVNEKETKNDEYYERERQRQNAVETGADNAVEEGSRKREEETSTLFLNSLVIFVPCSLPTKLERQCYSFLILTQTS